LLRDAAGRPHRIIGVSEDITARRNAEAALRTSEERFRTLVEAVPQLVWACRPDGYCDYLSRQWVEYTGIADEQEHHGIGWMQAVHPEDRDRTAEEWTRAISRQATYDVEYRLRRRDGEYRWFKARGVIQCDDHGEPSRIFGTSTDIEEQKRSAEALRRTEKLAAAGRLAASMSHEINNPLEGVTNLLFLALNDENLSEQTREYLQNADGELKRVSQITTQTLRFYRQNTNASTVTCMSLFDSVLALMRGRIQSRGIRVVEEYGAAPDIHCLEGEIRQALLNLVSNAVDAMSPAGGTLRLRSRHCSSQSFGEGVMLTVADTGTGMDAKTTAHIFEPFYTTKGMVGTGLGLYVTAEIVRKHRGSIRVRSRQGERHGTVVSLFLPIRYDGARSEVIEPAWAGATAGPLQ
jgi:PAS domain S-box-containing protein